jgi:hypothetical protein
MLFFVFILSFTLRLSISYSFPDIGYTQGMNDLVSRFHVVLKSEYKTYYCFLNFMERVEKEFLEDGMISKLGTVVLLLWQRVNVHSQTPI